MTSGGVPSSVGAGKVRRFRRFLPEDGRTVLVALDHAAYMGAGPPVSCLPAIAAGRPNGVLATWNMGRALPEAFADCGLLLRVDGGVSDLNEPRADDVSDILYRAEQALVLGADAVVALAFPGAVDEERSLTRLARLCAECEQLGLPVMAEMIPGGWARAVPWNTHTVKAAARIGVELGADIIKTVCPGPPEEFAAVAEASPAPVVALGGPKVDSEDQIVALAKGVVDAGAAGIAFGRNVWGSPDPTAMLGRLHEAVHGAAQP